MSLSAQIVRIGYQTFNWMGMMTKSLNVRNVLINTRQICVNTLTEVENGKMSEMQG